MKITLFTTIRTLSALVLISLASASFAEAVLEEITVTAQKRAESLQEVPMTVSAIGASEIQNAGIGTIQDVEYLVPALSIYSANQPALSSITIRGAGTGVSDPTLEPSVGVFVDGVFMPRSIFGLSDLVDVRQIEVLMGPQGTLYGRNTNAGVISVTTAGMPDEIEGFVSAGGGDFGLVNVQGSIGVPLSDNFGVRLGVISEQRDGYLTNDLTGEDNINESDKIALRGQIYWEPSDEFRARLIAFHSESKGNIGTSEAGWNTGSAQYAYYSTLLGLSGIAPPNADPTDRRVQVSFPNSSNVETDGVSLQLDYDFTNFTLTSITSALDWSNTDVKIDSGSTALPILTTRPPMEEDTFAQEIRLTSSGGEKIDWLAGLFYFDSDLNRGSATVPFAEYGLGTPGVPSPIAPALFPQLIAAGDYAFWQSGFRAESWAAFGQLTWNMTDETNVTFGLRYAEEDKDFDMSVTSFDADGTPYNVSNILTGDFTGGIFVPLTSGNFFEGGASVIPGLPEGGPTLRSRARSEDNVSGAISLNHFIGDHMLYATVATGTKSGGFNASFGAASAESREFDTENTTNYEVGAKFDRLLDGRARVNLSLFHTVYDDFQAATFDPVLVQFIVINAGEQQTSGVDIDATYLASDYLTLTARVEYLDAEYKDFVGANCHPLSGETINTSGQCDLSGQPLEFAADWTGSLTADLVLPVGDSSDIYGRVGLSFKTDHIADPTRAPYSRDVSYELWDARVGWRSDNWDVSVWGKNLTDETYARINSGTLLGTSFAGADGGLSALNYGSWINDPRTWGVTVRYDF